MPQKSNCWIPSPIIKKHSIQREDTFRIPRSTLPSWWEPNSVTQGTLCTKLTRRFGSTIIDWYSKSPFCGRRYLFQWKRRWAKPVEVIDGNLIRNDYTPPKGSYCGSNQLARSFCKRPITGPCKSHFCMGQSTGFKNHCTRYSFNNKTSIILKCSWLLAFKMLLFAPRKVVNIGRLKWLCRVI